jgi:ABC-type Mn2+/Zn2+ transport system ATPase subunit
VYNGIDITKMKPWERIKFGISLLRCENNSFSSLSIDDFNRLAKAHDSTLLTENGTRTIGSLSGGEHRRITFKNWINNSGNLGILDEPFVGMDQGNVLETLGLLTTKLMTIIIFEPLRTGVGMHE